MGESNSNNKDFKGVKGGNFTFVSTQTLQNTFPTRTKHDDLFTAKDFEQALRKASSRRTSAPAKGKKRT